MDFKKIFRATGASRIEQLNVYEDDDGVLYIEDNETDDPAFFRVDSRAETVEQVDRDDVSELELSRVEDFAGGRGGRYD